MARNELLNPAQNHNITLFTHVDSRTRTALHDGWTAIVDPYDTGYIGLLGTRNERGYFRDFEPRNKSDRVEYDFDKSMPIAVPGDWNTQDPSLLYYEGTVWYRRTFDADPQPGRRYFLHVGSANHTTRVFLNGEELATHVGGFGPFAAELTAALQSGENSLVLQVNNRREPDRIPTMRTDWWNFGGITGEVHLLDVPERFIRAASLTMAPDGSLVGSVAVGTEDDPDATVEFVDLGITVAAENGQFRFDAPDGLARWAPGKPVHHRVRFRCGDDVIDDEIGFRTVAVDGNQILVNGEATWLKGISLHSEAPSGGSRVHSPEHASTLLDWAEGLGCNFVRLAHYQHSEHMVREADRRGLLIWCELPVYWGIAFDDDDVLGNALDQCDELVVRDRCRAGVILWSVANETLPGERRNAFLAALAERCRDLDPTRLITAALLTLPSSDPETHVDDPLGEVVDVVAINQYLGWYYGDRDAIADARFTTEWGKPIVFSELGAGAKAGLHGDEDEIWTEEFQAAVYREQIAMIERQSDCAGMSPWILKDFRTPLRVLPDVQDGYNRKGLFSEEGEPKLAAEVLRDFYARRQ